ncbi:hypothetical protein Cgig2_026075 [Carnegiea gigantea]|uniref:ATP-dependent (S)-NAD(P)H-hydrate dehydratase n=1 Tax=Carnegiea gigantea TaxID=171969 RepID=A0A9Q1KLS1_9CARY|nr:hypothetical protein Cgig2_026075 [Carnegiea gigantea]
MIGGFTHLDVRSKWAMAIPDQNCEATMTALEADAINIIRRITPTIDLSKHKGQAGKIAVIGGCREYTGAPYFAAISALKIGADLSHVFCTKDAAPIIKSYSPELIVHPVLEESYSVREEDQRSIADEVLAEVNKYPCVVLTPNVNEYKRLVQRVFNTEMNDQEDPEQLLGLVKWLMIGSGSLRIGGITILKKGKSDLISDGNTVCSVSTIGSPRRCGGQGDILSGRHCRRILILGSQAHSKLKDPSMLACVAGSALLRKAASVAFENKKRATLTSDIIESLGKSNNAPAIVIIANERDVGKRMYSQVLR